MAVGQAPPRHALVRRSPAWTAAAALAWGEAGGGAAADSSAALAPLPPVAAAAAAALFAPLVRVVAWAARCGGA